MRAYRRDGLVAQARGVYVEAVLFDGRSVLVAVDSHGEVVARQVIARHLSVRLGAALLTEWLDRRQALPI